MERDEPIVAPAQTIEQPALREGFRDAAQREDRAGHRGLQQAVRCPASVTSAGIWLAQGSMASGQRGENGQPAGRRPSRGGAPSIAVNGPTGPDRLGTQALSRLV
ncbi:hypothetical protein D9M69_668460 [compost metagenome]